MEQIKAEFNNNVDTLKKLIDSYNIRLENYKESVEKYKNENPKSQDFLFTSNDGSPVSGSIPVKLAREIGHVDGDGETYTGSFTIDPPDSPGTYTYGYSVRSIMGNCITALEIKNDP